MLHRVQHTVLFSQVSKQLKFIHRHECALGNMSPDPPFDSIGLSLHLDNIPPQGVKTGAFVGYMTLHCFLEHPCAVLYDFCMFLHSVKGRCHEHGQERYSHGSSPLIKNPDNFKNNHTGYGCRRNGQNPVNHDLKYNFKIDRLDTPRQTDPHNPTHGRMGGGNGQTALKPAVPLWLPRN